MTFKIGKWKFTLEFIPIISKPSWMFDWEFNFILFHLAFFDLTGILTICNFNLRWEKLLKEHNLGSGL